MHPPAVTANCVDLYSKSCLYIKNIINCQSFLTDSGLDVSVVQKKIVHSKLRVQSFKLIAANGSNITFGRKILT